MNTLQHNLFFSNIFLTECLKLFLLQVKGQVDKDFIGGLGEIARLATDKNDYLDAEKNFSKNFLAMKDGSNNSQYPHLTEEDSRILELFNSYCSKYMKSHSTKTVKLYTNMLFSKSDGSFINWAKVICFLCFLHSYDITFPSAICHLDESVEDNIFLQPFQYPGPQ